MSIDHIRGKIKRLAGKALAGLDRRDVWAYLLAVCAGGAGVFGGLAWAGESNRPEIQIHSLPPLSVPVADCPASARPASTTQTSSSAPKGMFVASKAGAKYYLPSCSGAKSIAEANKIWFQSREEAERAGYTPSTACKGINTPP